MSKIIFWVKCRDDDEDAVAVLAPSAGAAIKAAQRAGQLENSTNIFDEAILYFGRFPKADRNFVPQIEADAAGKLIRSPGLKTAS